MRQNLHDLTGVTYLVGSADIAAAMPAVPALPPFDGRILEFLNAVAKALLADREAKAYPDVVTFAFWIRSASTKKLKERFCRDDGAVRLGRGVAFHIAPSNVPVNYAYSLAAGLLTGNANIVRVPSKDFPQVDIIDRALQSVLAMPEHREMRKRICLVRYGRDRAVNDALSAMADTRVIWGGDATIAEVRKSSLPPRGSEVTFADRFSLAVIDADKYLALEDKDHIAQDFYNDTYLTDQNACTSPRMVIWTGGKKEEAKAEFWRRLHDLVRKKYTFQPIQGVNKLTSGYLAAVNREGVRVAPHEDNLLVRVRVPALDGGVMDLKDNSGYFFEYDCGDILELKPLCDDSRCQTVSYLGDKDMFRPLLAAGGRGIDRIVPIGKTMDFDLIWDGYDLVSRLTRTVSMI